MIKIGASDPGTTTLFFVDMKNHPILFAIIVPKILEQYNSAVTVLRYGEFEFESMPLDEVSYTYFSDERPDYLYDVIEEMRPEQAVPRPANDTRGPFKPR